MSEATTEVFEECTFRVGMKLHEVEKVFILKTLECEEYNRTRTAKQLNIGIRTLQRKLKTWGLCNIGRSSQGGLK